MKIRITASGIYGADGEVPIGTEFDVSEAPVGWEGRFEIVQEAPAKNSKLTADNAPTGRK